MQAGQDRLHHPSVVRLCSFVECALQVHWQYLQIFWGLGKDACEPFQAILCDVLSVCILATGSHTTAKAIMLLPSSSNAEVEHSVADHESWSPDP